MNVVIINNAIRNNTNMIIQASKSKIHLIVYVKTNNVHFDDFSIFHCQQLSKRIRQPIYVITMTTLKKLSIENVYVQRVPELQRMVSKLNKQVQVHYFRDNQLFKTEPKWSNVYHYFYKYNKDVKIPQQPNKVQFSYDIKSIKQLQHVNTVKTQQYVSWKQIINRFNKCDQYDDTRNNIAPGIFTQQDFQQFGSFECSSSFLSPYISTGVVSIPHIINKYNYQQGTQFHKELFWNEFCYWYVQINLPFCQEKGYPEGGIYNREVAWTEYKSVIESLKQSHPFIEQLIKQLMKQGYMSNRARLLFANQCYLLNISWIQASQIFETYLIDFNESSNVFNWLFQYNLTAGQPHTMNLDRQLKKLKHNYNDYMNIQFD